MAGRRNAFLLLLMAATISVSLALYNGRVAPIGRYPWIGSLQPKLTDQHKCSVTVLSNRWTMTSAHCVPMGPKYYKVVLGPGSSVNYHIAEIHRHAHFARKGARYENDIALLYTSRVIEFSAHVKAAILPDLPVPPGISCMTVGRGLRYDESTEYVTLGMTEVQDGPHTDPVQADMAWQYIVPDPLMTSPVNGVLTHLDVYVRIPSLDSNDYFRIKVLRKTDTGTKYTEPFDMIYTPTSAGPQRVNVTSTWAIQAGDTIGLLYFYNQLRQARIPFRERVHCEMASLNYSNTYGKGGYYSPLNKYPCREYAMKAYIKVNTIRSVSAMAPRLEEIEVTVKTSHDDNITAVGKEAVPCKGDDGGTLSCNTGDGPVVYGMYSYSPGTCNASRTDAIYTQLSAYKGWISDTIRDCPEEERGNVTDIQVLQTK